MLKSVILLQISRSFVLVMTDFADVILKKKEVYVRTLVFVYLKNTGSGKNLNLCSR